LLDGGGDDDHARRAEVLGLVAYVNQNALLAQAFDIRVFVKIAALNFIAKVVQYLGNTAHPDATDTDKMDYAYGQRAKTAIIGFV
jgi:hypothetical protein